MPPTVNNLLIVATLLVCTSCAQTEKDVHGYQTGALITRADRIIDADPNHKNPETVNVIAYRLAYNVAVIQGNADAMRRALDNLHKAETRWGDR